MRMEESYSQTNQDLPPKGYDGRTTTRNDVQKMFMARPGARKDPEGYKQLGANMASIMPNV